MFERFTDQARRIVVSAQEEARRLDHQYIGTEHVLLALVRETEGVIGTVFEAVALSQTGVRVQVEQIIGRGPQPAVGQIPYTPRAKKVLELSVREALQFGHNYVGAEHIFLGLIREGEGVAAQVLSQHPVDLNRVRVLVSYGGALAVHEDLTKAARNREFEPITGRQDEIQAAVALLDDDPAANPLLVGEPGVGVTTVARGIAQEIAREPRYRQIHQLNLAQLAGGYPPSTEQLLGLIRQSGAPDVVVIVEHARSAIGTADGPRPAIDLLRPMLLNGEMRAIATATPGQQREWSATDGELYGRFQPIVVEELSEAVSVEALSELRYRYEARHRVAITDAAINAAVTLATRHIANKPLPGGAMNLLDHAAALAAGRMAPGRGGQSQALAAIRRLKDTSIDVQDFATASACREQEKVLLAREAAWRAEWKNTPAHTIISVTVADVEQALATRPAA